SASHKAELSCATDGGPAGLDVELGEDVLGVGAQRIDGDKEPCRNLRTGQVGGEEGGDLQLALAQLLSTDEYAGRGHRSPLATGEDQIGHPAHWPPRVLPQISAQQRLRCRALVEEEPAVSGGHRE